MSPLFDLQMDRRQMLATTAGAAVVLAAPLSVLAAEQKALQVGRDQPFDLGWKFRRGEDQGFEAADFADGDWRAVDLPHDWSIEDLPPEPGATIVGPFDRKAVGGTATGFAVGGDGWYRKRFRLNPPAGGRVEVRFDGVYMASDVWLNGHHLGAHPNGYTPFAYDLTPHLAADGENVIAVRVQNRGQNSRWYSGSGIYRHVWLDVLPEPARIARWGVGVVTRRITDAGAALEIATRLDDVGPELTLSSRVKDPSGRTVWEAAAPAGADVSQTTTIAAPRLWSPQTPALYTLETELRRGASVIDRQTTEFGIRVITFDVAQGMTVNGVPTKLRGGCIHHDNGLLGAAAFDAAEERKVRLLKARGYNALRASHNPFSPAFLRACDRQGMMVISEAFDAWRAPKLPQDYSTAFEDHWRSDLTAMVLSARNHPSVIMWSIGNEIPGRNLPSGVEAQWRLGNEVHKLDPTRPVTAAINDFPGRLLVPSETSARPGRAGAPDEASAVFLDVVGYNYKLAKYERDHQRFPNRIIYGSESFPKELFAIWELTDRSPWLLGDFVWTAMDYLGEAGIGGGIYAADAKGMALGAWPWVVSSCGDVDLIGHQRGQSLARDVVWGLSPLEIAVQKPPPEGKVELLRPWGWSDERQSWTWPGSEGQPLAVRVYTAGDRIELRLNGKRVEARPVTAADQKHVEFKVPYAAGTLEAVAFQGDREIARRKLTTAGAPAAIRLTPEAKRGGAGRGDVSYVAVEVVDAQGRRVADLETGLKASISGPAELAGFGSANPFAVGSLQSASARTFDGRALLILRGAGRAGRVRLEIRGEGLKSGVAALQLA
jgi:beta-galactosidase